MHATRLLPLLLTFGAVAACGDDSSTTGGGGGAGGTGTQASSTSSGPTSSTTAAGPTTTAGTGGDPTGSGGDPSGTTTGTGGTGTGTGTGGTGTGTGGSGTGTGGSGTGTGGAASAFPDDCDTAADCPGGDCVALASGFKACQFPVAEATECTSKLDECCSTEDCGVGGGLCVTFPDASYCGGPQPSPHNACTGGLGCIDCAKSNGTCLDAGFYGYNAGQCIPSGCGSDADCGDEAGGRCVPVFSPCCAAVTGLFCAYPSDGCRGQADCGPDQHCEGDLETGRAACVDGIAKCPA